MDIELLCLQAKSLFLQHRGSWKGIASSLFQKENPFWHHQKMIDQRYLPLPKPLVLRSDKKDIQIGIPIYRAIQLQLCQKGIFRLYMSL